MNKVSHEVVAIKIIKREQNGKACSDLLSELQLSSQIEPYMQDGLIKLLDYITDDEFEYLVRPYYNRGGIFEEL